MQECPPRAHIGSCFGFPCLREMPLVRLRPTVPCADCAVVLRFYRERPSRQRRFDLLAMGQSEIMSKTVRPRGLPRFQMNRTAFCIEHLAGVMDDGMRSRGESL